MSSALYLNTLPISKDSSSGSLENLDSVIELLPSHSEYEILWKVEKEGYYLGCVLYKGQVIGVPNFEVICLNGTYGLIVCICVL